MSAPDDEREAILSRCLGWASARFEHVYLNPTGVVIVPAGTTSVFTDGERTDDGRINVSIRATALQDVPPRPELYEYVALHAGCYLVGGLYLFREGDTLDLDCIARVWGDELDRERFLALVATVGRNAIELADALESHVGGHRLNPSGEVRPKLWGAASLAGRVDVADALSAALDTQSTAIMGAPWHVTFVRPLRGFRGELSDPVYAVTRGGIWVAGRERPGAAPVVWHVAHREIDRDVMHDQRTPYDYFALLGDSSSLTIEVSSRDEAYAILRARNEAA